MLTEDQLVAVDLIHGGEEEIAVRLLSSVVPWEYGCEAIRWAGSEVFGSLQVKYGACVIVMMGIFF